MNNYCKAHFYTRAEAVAYRNECQSDPSKRQVRMTSACIGKRGVWPKNYIYTVGYRYIANQE